MILNANVIVNIVSIVVGDTVRLKCFCQFRDRSSMCSQWIYFIIFFLKETYRWTFFFSVNVFCPHTFAGVRQWWMTWASVVVVRWSTLLTGMGSWLHSVVLLVQFSHVHKNCVLIVPQYNPRHMPDWNDIDKYFVHWAKRFVIEEKCLFYLTRTLPIPPQEWFILATGIII